MVLQFRRLVSEVKRLLPRIRQHTMIFHPRFDDQSDLANAFQVTRGAMTNTLARLEARRFVELRPDARDGRAKRVFLADAGRAARDRAIARIGPGIAGLLAEIPEAEFAAALPFLERLRKLLDSDDYRARLP